MSEEYDNEIIETTFSPFWPLLVLLIGLVGWSGYQVYAQNSQRSVYHQQFQAALPTLQQAQGVENRYVALMKDLVATAPKDPYADQIVKDAIRVGLIHVNPSTDTNSAATPAAPAK